MELLHGSPLPRQARRICWKESVTPRRSSHQSAASWKKTFLRRPGASWKSKVSQVAYAKTTRNTLFSRLEIKLVSPSLLTFNKPVHDFKAKARKWVTLHDLWTLKPQAPCWESQASSKYWQATTSTGGISSKARCSLHPQMHISSISALGYVEIYSRISFSLLFERISKAWDVEWSQQKNRADKVAARVIASNTHDHIIHASYIVERQQADNTWKIREHERSLN